MIRNLACLALVLVSLPAVTAHAQDDSRIPLTYEALSPTDPRATALWSDVADIIAYGQQNGVSPVQIMSSELPTSNGGTFVVQVLNGGGICTIEFCTARIAEDGVPIAEFTVCPDFSTHAISSDGTLFYACSAEFVIADQAPPPDLVPAAAQ